MAAEAHGPAVVDKQGRTTLPGSVRAAAGIQAGDRLVARTDGPGRILLEDPRLVLAAFRARLAAGRAQVAAAAGDPGAATTSLVDELLAERAADTSLDMPGDELHPDRSA